MTREVAYVRIDRRSASGALDALAEDVRAGLTSARNELPPAAATT